MKELKTVLQNAIEDYLLALTREPTIKDIEKICTYNLSEVVWDAVNTYRQYRHQEKVINGIRQSDAEKYLQKTASELLYKNTSEVIGTLKMLFNTAKTYGFRFFYGTDDGMAYRLMHTADDNRIIKAVGLEKIKK